MSEQINEKTIMGRVVSDSMDKTRSVIIERSIKHPRYKKFIRRSSKLLAHDATNETKIGDVVKLAQSRPLSKRKSWKIIDVVTTSV